MKLVHDPPERPERTAALGGKSTVPASKREILTGKGGPREVRRPVEFGGRYIGHILEDEVFVSKIRGVDGFFSGVNVVCPYAFPFRP